ncbi:MAG: protein kinase, partial [Acidobacteriia bacterium]|nr:protein kinase [Terriglobia bacterium]
MIGQTISHYRISEQLGSGGMGVVYKAEDTNLDRTVALKFLASHLLESEEHKQRFLREAKAAASLDHANICTVYEVGEVDGRVFLAMGYIDGPEVRAKIKERPLKLDEALDIAVQAGEGLRAAHQKGVVHRDIKSSNVMLTSAGQVKIMDFGLAQLTGGTRLTKTDTVLGTPAYMSPEQAQRLATDERTDIWSLGVVIYEMVTGRLPFAGEREPAVVYSIIHEPQEPMTAIRAGVPLELDRIVGKALAKNPEDRYQHVDDMLVDLRTLRGNLSATRTTSARAPARKQKKVVWVMAGVVGLLAAAVLLFTRTRVASPTAPARLEYTQLTNFTDSATSPALSPDGRMLTFIRGTETFTGRGEIYVKLLPDGEPVQLTRDGINKMSPVFSPGGDRIAYSVTGAMTDHGDWSTWTVPVFGGEPSLLLSNTSALTWVPGVTPPRVLFSEWGKGSHMSIITSTANRSEARTVYAPASLDAMAHRAYLSPDLKQVLVVEMEGGWRPCRVVPFDGSAPARLVGPSPGQCTTAAWSPDGEWMYFSINTGNGYHVWRQEFPGGAPEQVTSGATEEEGIAFAPDGRSFVTSVGSRLTTLWVHDSRGERQITSEGYASLPQFSADGRKLYYLVRSRDNRRYVSGELWAANLETGKRERLLPDFLIEHYSISTDGKRIVFAAIDETGHSPVWLATLDGGTAPRRLSSINAERTSFGTRGDVYFLGAEDAFKKFVYRVKEDGSGLQKAIQKPVGYFYEVSPDAKSLAVYEGAMVQVYPAEGGPPTMVCGICGAAGGPNRGITPPAVSWSPDGKFLYLNIRLTGQINAV